MKYIVTSSHKVIYFFRKNRLTPLIKEETKITLSTLKYVPNILICLDNGKSHHTKAVNFIYN